MCHIMLISQPSTYIWLCIKARMPIFFSFVWLKAFIYGLVYKSVVTGLCPTPADYLVIQQCISFVWLWRCCITPSFQHETSTEHHLYSVVNKWIIVLQVTMSLHIHCVLQVTTSLHIHCVLQVTMSLYIHFVLQVTMSQFTTVNYFIISATTKVQYNV